MVPDGCLGVAAYEEALEEIMKKRGTRDLAGILKDHHTQQKTMSLGSLD